MIVWRSDTPPAFLAGAVDCQRMGRIHWVASAGIIPPVDDLEWISTKAGYDVALHGDPEPMRLLRETTWQIPAQIIDGRGRIWPAPVLLLPGGTEATPRVRRMLPDGTWTHEYCDDRQRRALEAAHACSAHYGDADEAMTTAWALAILEAVLHLDGVTIGVLGLLDDVLVSHVLRLSSGLEPLP
jgi:hypothetical protein